MLDAVSPLSRLSKSPILMRYKVQGWRADYGLGYHPSRYDHWKARRQSLRDSGESTKSLQLPYRRMAHIRARSQLMRTSLQFVLSWVHVDSKTLYAQSTDLD